MSFLRKLFQLTGCSKLSNNKEDEEMENPKSLITEEDDDLFLYPEESLCDFLSDLHYIPGAWRSPSLGQRMVDRVRDSPKLARRAMTKMTSPMVCRKQKKDETKKTRRICGQRQTPPLARAEPSFSKHRKR